MSTSVTTSSTDGDMPGSQLLILIPVDGSEHSERAFDFYLKYMHKAERTVGIVHVHELTNTIVRIPLGSDMTEEAVESIIRAQWQKVDDLIDKYKKKCEAVKASYSVMIETKGKPGEVICRLVKEKNASQIVMGSRGLGTIRRTILGSVSQYCIDHAHIPITVIPPAKDG